MSYAILVTTCDSYSDTWGPFEILFKKYWPNCSADIYLVSESKVPNSKFYKKKISTYSGCIWSKRVKLALSHIDAKSILLMCDDYFVSNPIDNENLESLYSSFSEFNVGNLRLSPNPLPLNIYTKDSNFGKYDIKQPYRVSTQVGFWKKSFLLDLLKTEMPIHNFERMGSPASAEINEVILCTMKRSFPFIDAIHKGKWEQSAIQLCDLNHIDFNDSLRPMMSDYDYFRKYLKSIIYNKFPKIVTKIMALLTQYRSKKNV